MIKRHLKRLAAPRSWAIERKTTTWVTRSLPGGHRLDESLPLMHVIRDMLGYADTFREAKKILKEGNVLVDGKVVKEPKRAVGLMDIIEIPKTKDRFIVLNNKAGVLVLENLKATEVKNKLLRLDDKRIVKGGKVQLNFHDGRNLLIDPAEAKKYSTHDSIFLTLSNNKIKQHLKYGPGSLVFVTKGSHRGELAKIKDISKTRSSMANIVTLEKDGKEFRTVEDYLIVVGIDKPILSVMK